MAAKTMTYFFNTYRHGLIPVTTPRQARKHNHWTAIVTADTAVYRKGERVTGPAMRFTDSMGRPT